MAALSSQKVKRNKLNTEKILVIETSPAENLENLNVLESRALADTTPIEDQIPNGAQKDPKDKPVFEELTSERRRVLETKKKRLVLEVSHEQVASDDEQKATELETKEEINSTEIKEEVSTKDISEDSIKDVSMLGVDDRISDAGQMEWEDVIVESKTKTLTLVLNRGRKGTSVNSSQPEQASSGNSSLLDKDRIEVIESKTKELTVEANTPRGMSNQDDKVVPLEKAKDPENFGSDVKDLAVETSVKDFDIEPVIKVLENPFSGDSLTAISKNEDEIQEWEVIETKTKELTLEVEDPIDLSNAVKTEDATQGEVAEEPNLHADFCPVSDYASWPWMQQFVYNHWVLMWLLPILTLILGVICSYGSLVLLDIYIYGSDYHVGGVQDLIYQNIGQAVQDSINSIEVTVEHLLQDE